LSKIVNYDSSPIATFAIYGIKLFGMSFGDSPINPDGFAPTGLKYLKMPTCQSFLLSQFRIIIPHPAY